MLYVITLLCSSASSFILKEDDFVSIYVWLVV